jgi:alpha-N-arabinofuranosidase
MGLSPSAVEVSPDTGPHGGRAQRVQVAAPETGIAQWVCLPLHRVRKYEIEILARSPDVAALGVALCAQDSPRPCAKISLPGLSADWSTLRGSLEIDPRAPAEAVYRLAVTAGSAGQLVIARVLLRPADHVTGADPDVVRLLKQSRLPLLRWPGGNFVSAYHWEEGVGPTEARPTRPNYAWGGVEPNLFGTDEFMAFCRAVGCEPMICVNAGNGTPEEAARWVQYCNGPAESPMGRRRAAVGHRQPYNVRHWELGNELWGRWQCHWTTPAGYVDRYQRFRRVMLAADPTIRLYACGAPVLDDPQWNHVLIRGAASSLTAITDHPLIGGSLPTATDPLDVFRDFMLVPDMLAGKWGQLEREMAVAGVGQPRLAVTELQMFARLGAADGHAAARLTRENLVTPATQAEALYDVLIYHRAIRLAPFVEMVTHSATVNHGGGLRKERERVYANPCHWSQAGFAAFAGARPVRIEVTSPDEAAPFVLPGIKGQPAPHRYAAIDSLAALSESGSLLVSIVHRGSAGPIRVAVELGSFPAGPKADLYVLSADVPWAANTLQSPGAVKPRESTADIRDGKLLLDLKPFTWCRVQVPKAGRN